MEYLPLIGTVTLINILALISPGPDFIMCVRNSLMYSRKAGIWTGVGFALGIAVHIGYSLAGLALIISQSIIIFSIIKYLGAGYLIYIGLKSLLSKSSAITVGDQHRKHDISAFEAIKQGFLTNILNPKATLFILSLFTLVISPGTPITVLAIISAMLILNTILWFSFVAVFMTQKRIRSVFERFHNAINKTLGGLLIAMGVKVALAEK